MDLTRTDGNSWRGRNLNEIADEILQPIVRFGQTLEEPETSKAVEKGFESAEIVAPFTKFEETKQPVGLLGKGLSFLGKATEATTGILSFIKSFSKEYREGSHNYPETRRTLISSVGQIALGSAAATAVAAGAAAFGATAGLPLVLGGLAAMGTSALVKHLVEG